MPMMISRIFNTSAIIICVKGGRFGPNVHPKSRIPSSAYHKNTYPGQIVSIFSAAGTVRAHSNHVQPRRGCGAKPHVWGGLHVEGFADLAGLARRTLAATRTGGRALKDC